MRRVCEGETRARVAAERRADVSAACGTRSGYERHKRNDEIACADCKAAAAAYMRRHRTGNEEYRANQAALQRIRDEALLRLARIYRREYEALYAEVSAEIKGKAS
jgi:ketosteroid isomerase-like protein